MLNTGTIRGPSERTLNRLIIGAILILGIGIPALAVIYFADQYVDPGPTLVQREVTKAEQAVKQDPNNIGLRLVLATAYVAGHRPDDALRQYDEILQANPSHRGALLGKGDALVAKGDLDGAKAAYQKLVDDAAGGEFAMADTQLAAAYYSLGSIAMKQARPNDAVAALESALKVDGTDSDAWDLLGSAQLAAGNADKAVAALRNAVTFVPTGWTEPYATLAKAYQAMGKTDEAAVAAAMADFNDNRVTDARRQLAGLTTGPAASDAMFGLGLIAETQGDAPGAAGWYRKVLAVDPKSTAAQAGLARATNDAAAGARPSGVPASQPVGGNG